MKRAFQIFRRDIRRLSRSWVAMIVAGGVCLIPSLYAWFNIAANYDPYSNTSGIQIAVANADKGADTKLTGRMDAGQEIVDNLKENDALGWTFVEEEQAVAGVESGKYYAAIVIPEDFSESLTSILSGEISQPKFTYYLNEKKNAIAPKITDAGASEIEKEINTAFVSATSEAISKILESSVSGLAGNLDTMQEDLVSDMQKIMENLAQYQKTIEEFQNTLQDSPVQIQEAQAALDNVKDAAASGEAVLNQSGELLTSVEESASKFRSSLSGALTNGENSLADISNTAGLDFGAVNEQIQTVHQQIDGTTASISNVIEQNQKIIDGLKEVAKLVPESFVSQLIEQLESQNGRYQEILNQLREGNMQTAGTESVTGILGEVRGTQVQLRASKDSLEQKLFPWLNQSLNSFARLSGKVSGVLSGISPSTDQLKSILASLDSGLSDTKKGLESTQNTLESVQEQLTQIVTDADALKNSQSYQDFLSLTGMDEETVAQFMASPVQLKTESFYPVENYGSALAPFYTNLAIWVGGIVLIAIFKLEVDRDEKVRQFTAVQSYMGRWMLFVVFGMIQALIICLGDLYLLKIQCESPGAFVFAGIFASFVYVNIIYALSITFKHIGKALSVILVIIQIPGSAGTYPIEMTPVFFQKLHPLLPFTYGINAMREASAGIYQYHYAENLLCLAVYIPVFLVIGIGIRPLLLNLNRMFDNKLAETDLMICEEEGMTKERVRLSAAVKILVGQEGFKEELYRKAEKFEANYRKRIRRGFLAILIIPVIFLILMFSISSKMVFLALWIASIIGIAVYLICIEYLHESLHRRKKLMEMSQEELMEILRDSKEKGEKEA